MKRFAIIMAVLFLLPSVAYAIGAIKGEGAAGNTWPMGCEKTTDGRCMQTPAQKALQIDSCDSVTGWAVLGNDASGLAIDLDHVEGSHSLEYDAVDGAAGLKIKGIARTLTSVNLTDYVESGGFLSYSLNVSSTANIDYCFIWLGTSVSHYNEWRIDGDSLSTGWNALRFNANAPATAGATGNGISWGSVQFVAVGCGHDAETDALADIRVDNIFATRGYNVSADINATASSSGTTTKVDLIEVAGTATNVNGGNRDTGTQTTTLADDDPAVVDLAAIEVLQTAIEGDTTAIQTAVELIDDTVAVYGMTAPAKGIQLAVEARTTRGTAIGNGDAVRLTANAYGEAFIAGYTYATNSNRHQDINPPTEAHLENTLCDLTNIAADTTGYCGYWDMDGSRHFSAQIETSGTAPTDVLTVTLECSNQDDTTAPSSVAYQDVTESLTGAPSLIDEDGFWIVDVSVPFKYCRIKYVTSDTGGSDADLTVFLKKMW